jgi:hypothetical protein
LCNPFRHSATPLYLEKLEYITFKSNTLGKMSGTRLLFLAYVAIASVSQGFSPVVRPFSRAGTASTSTTHLNIFGDALKGAFSNDDTLGKRKDEGLSRGPDYNNAVTVNGKEVKGAVVGQKLTVVASRVRVKIPVNCQQGDCGA